MNNLLELLSAHREFWSADDDEGVLLKSQILDGEYIFDRNNWNGHATASALVFNEFDRKVLFIQSTKFNKLLLPGGHVENGESLNEASKRELYEEVGVCGLDAYEFLSGLAIPLEINTHKISRNEKKSEPEHVHHDFVYLFFTLSDFTAVTPANDESSMVTWLELEALKGLYPRSFYRIIKKIGERI